LGAIRKIQMNIFQVGAKGKPGYVGLFAWRWVKTTNLRFQSSTATSLMVWSSLVAVYMVYGGLWGSMGFSPKVHHIPSLFCFCFCHPNWIARRTRHRWISNHFTLWQSQIFNCLSRRTCKKTPPRSIYLFINF
jgi:hypothetical protein